MQSYRLVLVGIGVSATLDAVTSYLLVRAKITVATAASQWLVGSLSSTSWSTVWPLVVVAAVCVPIALATSAALGIGQLGDEVATGVGLGVQRHRLLVIALAVVLTAAAVAAAGPIGFVAFVVPQVALRLAGRTGRRCCSPAPSGRSSSWSPTCSPARPSPGRSPSGS